MNIYVTNKALPFIVAGLCIASALLYAQVMETTASIRFGIVTDSHYADTDSRGKRHYRESMAKMREYVELMNEKKVDFLIELGDMKDQDSPATEASVIKYLKAIETVFREFKGPRYHALGNHDMDSISKEQFLACVENSGIPSSSKYYSFDSNKWHFVVLDANYTTDGIEYDHGNFIWTNTIIPQMELEWLKTDLASSAKPTIVFIHQRLDGNGSECVKNSDKIREILQKDKKVIAVFQGHKHDGDYSYIEGIHYYTLKGMIEGSGIDNNSYAIVEIHNDHNITVTGYRKALSKNLPMHNKANSSD